MFNRPYIDLSSAQRSRIPTASLRDARTLAITITVDLDAEFATEYVRRYASERTHFVGFSFAGIEYGRSSNETQHGGIAEKNGSANLAMTPYTKGQSCVRDL
jgi:hypothetical protein